MTAFMEYKLDRTSLERHEFYIKDNDGFRILNQDDILQILREADEIVTWGHPLFQIKNLFDEELFEDEDPAEKFFDLKREIFRQTQLELSLSRSVYATLALPALRTTNAVAKAQSNLTILQLLFAFLERNGFIYALHKDQKIKVEIDLDQIRLENRDV